VRIVGRYLLARFLVSLFSVLVVLVLLILVVEILLNVEEILEADGGFTSLFLKIGSSYLLQYLLPASALFGGFIALGSAARSRETLALKAGGISPLAATLPIAMAGVVLALGSYLLSDTVVVAASKAFNRMTQKGTGDLVLRQGTFWYHNGRYVYNFADRDEDGGRVHDVVVFERDDRHRLVRRISARSATVREGRRWHFEAATSRRFDPDAPGSPPLVEEAEEIVVELDEEPSAALLKREVAALSSGDLRGYIATRAGKGRDVTRGKALLQDRYTEPLAVLLFSLLAIPLGLRVEQTRSLSRGALQAVMVMFVYYSVRQTASTLAAEGVLPAVAPWAAVALFLAAGGVALARLPR
jgi:lipopolysaccharide export system permease protein